MKKRVTTSPRVALAALLPAVALGLAAPRPAVAATCAAQASGIVAWWPGDGNAFDLAGASDGALVGGATYGSGRVGRAFSLAGTGDFVDLGAGGADFAGGTADFTVATWVRLRSYPPALTANHATIVHKATFDPYSGWGLYVYADGRLGFGGIGVWEVTSAPGAIPLGGWAHVAVTREGSAYRLYRDGEEVAATTHGNLETSAAALQIGSAFNGLNGGGVPSDTRLSGLVDETMVFGHALAAAELRAIFAAGEAGVCRPCAPLPPGALARWKADGNALDGVGAHDAVLIGGAAYAPGRAGSAFSFDGVDDYVDAGAGEAFDFSGGTGDFTVDAWIKPAALPAVGAGIVSKATQGPFSGWSFYVYADGRLGFGGVGAWEVTTAPGTIEAGVWAHVAVTKTGGVYRLYKDGVEAASRDHGDLETSTTALRIGTDYVDTYRFAGLVDDVGVFARALAPAELAALVDGGNGGTCPAGLVSWWKADGSGDDALGTHHGVLQGGAAFAAGVAGRAFSLDGVDDSVDLGPWFDLQSYTLELWVKPGSAQKTYADIVDNNHTGVRSWVLQQKADVLNEYGYGVNDGGVEATVQLAADRWTHLVMTRDGATRAGALYADGALLAGWTGTGDVPYDGSQFLRLGTWGGTCCTYLDRHWNGLLDDVRVYDRALDAAEVNLLRGPDAVPAAFAFADRTGAPLSALVASEPVTIEGVNVATPISVAGGEYAVNDGDFTAAAGVVFDGDSVAVRLTTAAALGARTDATLTVGGVSDVFSVTTWEPCAPPTVGLVSWWRGDGDATDGAGTNDGALVNGAGFAAGRVGEAFSLDGSNQYVEVPDAPEFDIGAGDFSLSLWAKYDTVRAGVVWSLPNVFLGQDAGGGPQNKWVFVSADDGLYLLLYSGGNHLVGPAPFTPAPGAWHHLALTRSGAAYTFYVDGAAVGSPIVDPVVIPPVAGPVTIGKAEELGYFDGLLDEIQIHSRALTADEVAARHAGTEELVCPGPRVGVEPAAHDFGDVPVGSSGTRDFTLSNDGQAPLSVTSVVTSGGDAAAFTVVPGAVDGCPEGLAATLAPGESCTLTATFEPASGGAKGARLVVVSDDPYEAEPGADLSGRGTHRLDVAVVPPTGAGGSVSAAGGAIACPGDCDGAFPGGTVELTATAAAGWEFSGWSGDETATEATITVAMDADKSLTATFAYVPVERTVCAAECDFALVQDAIDAAGPGDTVLLSPGTHRANLLVAVDQDLTIRGTGARPSATVLSGDLDGDGAGDGTVLRYAPASGPGGTLRLENLTVTKGAGMPDGGGIAVAGGSALRTTRLTLARVVVRKNRAAGEGGGIWLNAGVGWTDVRLENVMVTENTAVRGAGICALADPENATMIVDLVNTSVAWNGASASGGGLEARTSAGGEVAIRALNAIVRGNRAPAGADGRLRQDAGLVWFPATYSAVGTVLSEGAAYDPGVGMVTVDPVFVNPAAATGDFHLNADSPCMGAALPVDGLATDFEGDARPLGAGPDIGADEAAARRFAAVTLLSLKGGESIPGGASYNVTWGGPKAAVKYKAFWSQDRGLTWKQVGTGFTTARHKAWKPPVPARTAKTWKVRVEGYTAAGLKVGTATGALFTVRR